MIFRVKLPLNQNDMKVVIVEALNWAAVKPCLYA